MSRYRSPSHRFAELAGRPDDLEAVAAASVVIRGALDALAANDLDLARRLWKAVDGDDLLRRWNEQGEALKARSVATRGPSGTSRSRGKRASIGRRVSEQVFQRDGYRCRYCGVDVVTRWRGGDIPRLVMAFPDVTPQVTVVNGDLIGTGKSGALRNGDSAKWLWLVACADHVHPRSLGGTDDMDNLVTACGGCNYGKDNLTVEELEIDDPRSMAMPVEPAVAGPHIYVVGERGERYAPVKIGMTAGPASRSGRSALSSGNWRELVVLHRVEVPYALLRWTEWCVHEHLAPWRRRGEWFDVRSFADEPGGWGRFIERALSQTVPGGNPVRVGTEDHRIVTMRRITMGEPRQFEAECCCGTVVRGRRGEALVTVQARFIAEHAGPIG